MKKPTAIINLSLYFTPEKLAGLLKENKFYLASLVFCVLIGLAIVIKIFWPAYQQPENRMYSSKLGYANLTRQVGGSFKVETEQAQVKSLTHHLIGEGYFASQSLLVPVIPLAHILTVEVEEGDEVKKGQRLATLDTSKIALKLRSARLAVETAKAELARVEIGSAYVLAQERPGKDLIGLSAAQKRLELLKAEEVSFKKLLETGAIPKNMLIELQKEIVLTEAEVAEAKFNLEMSSRGQPKSKRIAENAIEEALHALEHRELELKGYEILAPCDGIVENILIQPGEYNQDTGKPAFVIASDLWFEAHLDQTALNRVSVGDTSTVHLEAMPNQSLSGKISRVIPVVTFNQGGPETNRPIRPRGTGAPEWPSTFKVRVKVDPPGIGMRLTPGMTGFAKIKSTRETLAVPMSAVTSKSAGKGMIHYPTADGRNKKVVRYGIEQNNWLEIMDGIQESTILITSGQHALTEGDKIKITKGPGYLGGSESDLISANP